MDNSSQLDKRKIYRWWQVFKKTPNSVLLCPTNEVHCKKSQSTRHWAIFPVVYAAENPQNGTSENRKDNLTLMDKVTQGRPKVIVSDREVQDYLLKETGRDRLNAMFSKNNKGQYSNELELIVNCTKVASFLTFVITSALGGMNARDKFIREHQHTKFQTRFRAARAYRDAVFVGGIKVGAVLAFKTALFTGILLTTAQCIAVYRNKTSPFEYMAGGVVTGSVLKMNLGLRGIVGGGIIGGAFGLAGGTLLWLAMYVSNETQQQRHHWQIQQALLEKRELDILLKRTDASTS